MRTGIQHTLPETQKFLRKAFILAVWLSLLLPACSGLQSQGRDGNELTVFAAASLTNAFTEIGKQYEESHPDTQVTFNFAGSQQLAQQLNQGAPADVFASADDEQMLVAVQGGRIDPDAQQPFVNNALVVVYPRGNPGGLQNLHDLARPGLKLVLAAGPVPAGQYALDFLEKASLDPSYGENYKQEVLQNVASYEENVRAVLTKVALGEADAGIVYASDAFTASPGTINTLEIPANLNVVADYPIARVADSAHSKLAGDFIDYVLSNVGQQVLADNGFIPVR